MRQIFGADFSGAMNPKIYYVHGVLDGNHLTLLSQTVCDDRLDLFYAIVQSGDALWGLDFPFGIPQPALKQLGFDSWIGFLNTAIKMTRPEFAQWLKDEINDYPRKCAETDGVYCRATDVAVEAHSVFKTVNPNLRVMLYAGLRLLKYLWDMGVNVYPFGHQRGAIDELAPTVHEIYPSYAWQVVGMRRSTDVRTFVERFNKLNLITVDSVIDDSTIDNQDVADSVVACVMMATAYVTQLQGTDWNDPLPCVNDAEWQYRLTEGLIVRF